MFLCYLRLLLSRITYVFTSHQSTFQTNLSYLHSSHITKTFISRSHLKMYEYHCIIYQNIKLFDARPWVSARPSCRIHPARRTQDVLLRFSCAVQWNAITYHINWCVSSQHRAVSHTSLGILNQPLHQQRRPEYRRNEKKMALFGGKLFTVQLRSRCVKYCRGLGRSSSQSMRFDRYNTGGSWNISVCAVHLETNMLQIYAILALDINWKCRRVKRLVVFISHSRLVIRDHQTIIVLHSI